MMNNLPTVDTTKHVTIESEKNVVFEFETTSSSLSQRDDDEPSSVRRQLDLSDDDVDSEQDDVEVVHAATTQRSNSSSNVVQAIWSHDVLMAVVMLLIWSCSSSCLTVVMQSVLMHERMSLPLMIPALSQLGCAIVVRILDRLDIITLKPMPPCREYMRKIFPL